MTDGRYNLMLDEDLGPVLVDSSIALALVPSTDEVLYLADDVPSGVMVALYPEPELARQLAIDGGEDPEQLHVTLAFIGEASALSELDVERLKELVWEWAANRDEIDGTVSGIGLFTAGEHPVTYHSVDCPALPLARQDLVDNLQAAGFTPSTEHGFTPHITLDYADRVKDATESSPPIEFRRASVVVGPRRWDYAFGAAKGHGLSDDAPVDVGLAWSPEARIAAVEARRRLHGFPLTQEGHLLPQRIFHHGYEDEAVDDAFSREKGRVELKHVPVEKLVPINAGMDRASIDHALDNPERVTPEGTRLHDGRVLLFDGNHTAAARILMGRKTVPVMVDEPEDTTGLSETLNLAWTPEARVAAIEARRQHRHGPQVLPWHEPPVPRGKAGERKGGGITAIGITNTRLGDAVEGALAQHLGFEDAHPGRRQGPFDLYHGQNAYEVKAATTDATEYKAKPKRHEVEGKRAHAEANGLQPHTLIAVYDHDIGHVYAYSRPGVGAYRLTGPEYGWSYHGSVPVDLSEEDTVGLSEELHLAWTQASRDAAAEKRHEEAMTHELEGLDWQETPQSSNVSGFAWRRKGSVGSTAHGDLYIRFDWGGVYRYPNITHQRFSHLQRAMSKGKFVNRMKKLGHAEQVAALSEILDVLELAEEFEGEERMDLFDPFHDELGRFAHSLVGKLPEEHHGWANERRLLLKDAGFHDVHIDVVKPSVRSSEHHVTWHHAGRPILRDIVWRGRDGRTQAKEQSVRAAARRYGVEGRPSESLHREVMLMRRGSSMELPNGRFIHALHSDLFEVRDANGEKISGPHGSVRDVLSSALSKKPDVEGHALVEGDTKPLHLTGEPGVYVEGLKPGSEDDPAIRTAVRAAFRQWRGRYTEDEMQYRLDNGKSIDEMLAANPMRVVKQTDGYLTVRVKDWDVETGAIEGEREFTVLFSRPDQPMGHVRVTIGDDHSQVAGHVRDEEWKRIWEQESGTR